MASQWTCPKCKTRQPRVKQKCLTDGCEGRRPARRRPKHQLVLEYPLEWWIARFGSTCPSCNGEGCDGCADGLVQRCGVCGRPPGPNRNLDRDHSHLDGSARGLLCHRCNRALASWVDVDWLMKAVAYLQRAESGDRTLGL